MGKLEENKQSKQSRLLDTAFALYTTKGITKTSISDIVNAAGVGKGTFYLYFRDKYDIANHLVARRGHSICHQALCALAKTEIELPEERVIFVLNSILDHFQREPVLLRFINKNLSWGLFRQAIQQDEPGVEHFLKEIFRDSISEWRDLETMLYLIIEMVSGSCYSVILDHDPMPLEEFKPHLFFAVRCILKGSHDLKTV